MNRRRPLTWLLLSAACFLGALYFWRLGNERLAKKTTATTSAASTANSKRPGPAKGARETAKPASTAPMVFLGKPKSTNAAAITARATREAWLKYRLSNTTKTVGELARSDKAILLENALIDTSQPWNPVIPEKLRAQGDPGTYIVQARGLIDDGFRAALKAAGADIVSYIPNNAYLVRASASVAQQLAAGPAQSVLPFEPYYKLSPALLRAVMEQQTPPPDAALNVLVFPDAAPDALRKLGNIVAEAPSPFGRIITLEGADAPTLARLPIVERVEIASRRVPANDLSRATVGVAADSVTQTNYLNLSGSNVLVQVNDTGVDAQHPDLENPDLSARVFSDFLTSLVDANGHGTHVAGIIAGNGAESTTVTNAIGSTMPATTNQFRGMAPAAQIYSQPLYLSDFDLQEAAARTNALISNNSWNYSDNDYDIAAASYDAAVRDALPEVQGSQPVLFVFSAGDSGSGADNGLGGNAESIQSPATAKNVITVGALEQPRNITNNVVVDGQTNQPWAGLTDSDNEVASFSSRGNVGIGIEGDAGRFKPDVVAPGVFVVSTRSGQWDTNAYYNPTNYDFNSFTNQTVDTNTLNNYSIFVPDNAVQLIISVTNFNPTNVTGLPIYVRQNGIPTTGNLLGTNQVSFPPDLPTGASLFYSIGNPTNVPVGYDVVTEIISTNDVGNYYVVLQGLNDSIGTPGPNRQGWYRYETGTSMSAAEASGVLALIQDYFTNTLQALPSPALLKALLINGARSVNTLPGYDFHVNKTLNYQGWGLINLPNSIPSSLPTNGATAIWNALTNGPSPLLLFDQSPTNALATGDSQTIFVSVDPSAQSDPLRVTLVWTDPPGNPAAGIKLVNNLDLVVTNLDTGDVFIGNDIQAGANFNFRWDTNGPPNLDVINNVENVYLAPNLSTNYSITVVGRAVNVNAVTAHPNNVAQDYALVISNDSQSTNSLAITNAANSGLTFVTSPNVTLMTNEFASTPGLTGQLLLDQHVGANTPLLGTNAIALGTNTMWGTNGAITLGMTNQWRFYVLENTNGFTNAAFATFLPTDLGLPRMGVTNVDNPNNATRVEADIDLYVTTDPALTNLDPAAIANAYKSLDRGGTEVIALTNAVPGVVYYVGVKSEDQEAAEYAFFGAFSQQPFSTMANGIQRLRGINVPALIPDGSPALPGVTNVLFIAVYPITVQRAVVTNIMTHQNFGDLLGTISHNRKFAVLNNHTFPPGDPTPFTYAYVYEDNGQNDIGSSQHTDGPGSLRNFVGEKGTGLWLLTEVDNALTHTGAVDNAWIRLDPSASGAGTNGVVLTVEPNSFVYDAVDVPPEATNLTISIVNESTTPLPLQLYVRRGDFPTQTAFDYTQTINLNGSLSINALSVPPLRPGRYYIGIFNPNNIAQTVRLVVRLDLSVVSISTVNFTSGGPTPILDDAVSYSTITITNIPNNVQIAQASVGVVIDHPRVSDLVLTLISPSGQRILLFENRGGPNTSNLGSDMQVTNYFGTQVAGGPNANTNVLSPVPTSGTLIVDYDFYPVPDTMNVYYDGVDIFSSGYVSNSGTFTIAYGPGTGNSLTIVMNQGGNPQTNTAWIYTPRVVSDVVSYFTFTDDTNFTDIPIKFALPPYNNLSSAANFNFSFFDSAAATNYLAPTNVMPDGWTVLSNQVSVVNDPANAQSPPQFLALAKGVISNTLSVTPGSQYNLSFAYRGPGIVGWWRGENNGNDEIYGNTGTLQNVTFTPGIVGQAFAFDPENYPYGTYTGVRIPDQPAFMLTNSLTIEGWIRPRGPGYSILWRGDQRPGLDPYVLSMEGNNTVVFQIEDQLKNFASVSAPLVYNQWWYVAGTLDGSSGIMSLYLNGTLVSQTSTTIRPFANLITSDCPALGIGNVADCSNLFPFWGDIDEISLYSRALSASEVKAIYNAGSVGKFDPNPSLTPPQNLAEAQVSLGGIRADTIFGNNTNWQTWNLAFTPATTSVPLTVTGIEPGMLLDSFTLTQVPGEVFVLPEESLQSLIGQSPNGTWTLEIRDDRTGAPIGTTQLVSWQLQFILTTNVPLPTPLLPFGPVTNTILPCAWSYFSVDVPFWVNIVTNILVSATAPVNLWFNQNILPTGNLGAGDFELLANATTGSYTLFTNGTPPLIPGAPYYLGVENPCSNGTNVTVVMQVDFGMITLTNMVPYVASSYANSNLGTIFTSDYYRFVVPTNAARAQFEIDNPGGVIALAVRKGWPPPDMYSYDYLSDNPGTNNELIVLFTNSTPMALSAGDWYLTAVNLSGTNVTYSIMASWWPTTGRPITITNAFQSSSNSFCITWTSLPDVHYFIQGATNLSSGIWTTVVPDILGATNATTTTECIPLPSPYHFFRVGEGLILNAYLPPVNLGDGTTATNVIPACQFQDYTVDVPPSAAFATNTIVFASAPVNVWFNQTNFPTGTNAGDVVLITNATTGSSFTLSTNGTPPLVPGATYYLGVENPCSNGSNVTVAIRLDIGLGIITLTNGIPYFNTNPGGNNATNYYRYVVSGTAARVQFEIDNPRGDMTLVARRGLPLPTLAGYDYISANPSTNDELIVVFNNSTPVPLAPGDWYLSAVNISGGPVFYGIKATEWPTTGRPISINGTFQSGTNSFCITWSSLPGVRYFIQGVTNLTAGMIWQTVVQDIVATSTTTTECIPLPSPYHFFRVVEGQALAVSPPVVSVTQTNGGFLLRWTGPVTAQYQVQWTPSLSSPTWTPISIPAGQFWFLDDGSQTGGLGATRFYRVVVLQ